MVYAQAIYNDDSATLGDLREAVTTLEDTARIARRVLGGAHPLTKRMEQDLREARAALRADKFWFPLFVCAFFSVVAWVCWTCPGKGAVFFTLLSMVAWWQSPA